MVGPDGRSLIEPYYSRQQEPKEVPEGRPLAQNIIDSSQEFPLQEPLGDFSFRNTEVDP